MNKCFCGCGMKVKWRSKRMNRRGRETKAVLNDLEALRDRIDGLVQSAGPDKTKTQVDAMSLLSQTVEGPISLGSPYVEKFRDFVHGVSHTDRPDEGWGKWQSDTAFFRAMCSQPDDQLWEQMRQVNPSGGNSSISSV